MVLVDQTADPFFRAVGCCVFDLEVAISKVLVPTWPEVVRAKKLITNIASDGRVHGVREYQECLCVADGVSVDGDHGEMVHVLPADDMGDAIQAAVNRDLPLLARNRLLLAASEALVDLMAEGILVEVAQAPNNKSSYPLIRDNHVNITYHVAASGVTATFQYPAPVPNFAQAYRLAPRLRRQATQWFADPDVFTTDLGQLQLPGRTSRCIAEALDAYRRGLYLACANMLGAASEGAWYAAGERLRSLDTQLAKALDGDRTSTVVRQVFFLLQQTKGPAKGLVDGLHGLEALLRDLRNYGVHPRGYDTDHLERYFSDSGAAILLMETHSYLTRLASAVEARLEQEVKAAE